MLESPIPAPPLFDQDHGVMDFEDKSPPLSPTEVSEDSMEVSISDCSMTDEDGSPGKRKDEDSYSSLQHLEKEFDYTMPILSNSSRDAESAASEMEVVSVESDRSMTDKSPLPIESSPPLSTSSTEASTPSSYYFESSHSDEEEVEVSERAMAQERLPPPTELTPGYSVTEVTVESDYVDMMPPPVELTPPASTFEDFDGNYSEADTSIGSDHAMTTEGDDSSEDSLDVESEDESESSLEDFGEDYEKMLESNGWNYKPDVMSTDGSSDIEDEESESSLEEEFDWDYEELDELEELKGCPEEVTCREDQYEQEKPIRSPTSTPTRPTIRADRTVRPYDDLSPELQKSEMESPSKLSMLSKLTRSRGTPTPQRHRVQRAILGANNEDGSDCNNNKSKDESRRSRFRSQCAGHKPGNRKIQIRNNNDQLSTSEHSMQGRKSNSSINSNQPMSEAATRSINNSSRRRPPPRRSSSNRNIQRGINRSISRSRSLKDLDVSNHELDVSEELDVSNRDRLAMSEHSVHRQTSVIKHHKVLDSPNRAKGSLHILCQRDREWLFKIEKSIKRVIISESSHHKILDSTNPAEGDPSSMQPPSRDMSSRDASDKGRLSERDNSLQKRIQRGWNRCINRSRSRSNDDTVRRRDGRSKDRVTEKENSISRIQRSISRTINRSRSRSCEDMTRRDGQSKDVPSEKENSIRRIQRSITRTINRSRSRSSDDMVNRDERSKDRLSSNENPIQDRIQKSIRRSISRSRSSKDLSSRELSTKGQLSDSELSLQRSLSNSSHHHPSSYSNHDVTKQNPPRRNLSSKGSKDPRKKDGLSVSENNILVQTSGDDKMSNKNISPRKQLARSRSRSSRNLGNKDRLSISENSVQRRMQSGINRSINRSRSCKDLSNSDDQLSDSEHSVLRHLSASNHGARNHCQPSSYSNRSTKKPPLRELPRRSKSSRDFGRSSSSRDLYSSKDRLSISENYAQRSHRDLGNSEDQLSVSEHSSVQRFRETIKIYRDNSSHRKPSSYTNHSKTRSSPRKPPSRSRSSRDLGSKDRLSEISLQKSNKDRISASEHFMQKSVSSISSNSSNGSKDSDIPPLKRLASIHTSAPHTSTPSSVTFDGANSNDSTSKGHGDFDSSKGFSWRSDPKKSFSDWTLHILYCDEASGKRRIDVYHLHRNVVGFGHRKSNHLLRDILKKEREDNIDFNTKTEIEAKDYMESPNVRKSSDRKKKDSKITQLKLPTVMQARSIPYVLDFIYYSNETKPKMSAELSCNVFKVAQILQVKALQKAICDFYTKNLTLKNLGEFFAAATKLKIEKLLTICKSKTGRMIATKPELSALIPPKFLAEILSGSGLDTSVSNNTTVLHTLVNEQGSSTNIVLCFEQSTEKSMRKSHRKIS